MATKLAQMQYSDNPELKKFTLNDVSRTGTTLGRGAFGVVEELKMGGTLCAGKRLHPELLNVYNEQEGIKRTIKRFIEECSLMSKMLHPRIVQFMGLCFFDDNPYPMLVMEKLDVNLETILETHKNIPFPLILHILQDIAEGLIHLHSQRPPIIHRDLTARNVLVNQRSFRAKISDLGNARLCLADHTKFTHTLTQAPGTLSYMPPEALAYRPTYDGRLDMFSFGHLALFAVIQEFPKDLEAPTYYDRNGDFKGRNEVERREKYVEKLITKLTKDHVVAKMILQCLHNLPQNRPTAKQVMEQIVSVATVEDDAYGQVNLVELIHKADQGESKAAYYDIDTAGGDQIMKRRISNFKNGAPGVLDIFRVSGKVTLSKKQVWRTHMFKIKDGTLNYFRQEMMDRPYASLDLSSVKGVNACPPKEAWKKSMFYFEVHFSGVSGSPWLLGAYTQDDRTCWMEAIYAGSSAIFKPATPDSQYEPVIPVPDNEVYSYARVSRFECHHQTQERKELKSLYDNPDAPVMIQTQVPSQSQVITKDTPPSHLEHPSQAKTRRERSKSPAKAPLAMTETLVPDNKNNTVPPASSPQHMYVTVPDGKEPYDVVDATASTESTGEYEDMNQENPPLQAKSPRRSVTVPKELSALAETSIEDLSNMNPSEAQLWMLNQMQKLVEKFAGIYESTAVGPLPKETKSNRGKVLPAQAEGVYENLQSLPPVPPRTYSCSVQKTEGSISSRKISRQSKTVNAGNRPPPPSIERSPHHLSTTTGPPPLRSKPDVTAIGRGSRSLPVTVTIKQKREATHEEMISTLKARNKNLSSEITSHLITSDDSSGSAATTAAKPEWTRAKTQSSQLAELSLADLEQKALFLPRSALSENLEEIGHGQFGKIFKGVYKKSEGEGLPVAIKTIKKYESEKERQNFQKEMAVMSKLIHPNIVRLFGLVKQDQPWIVLEFLPHGDLKAFLTKKKQPVNKLIKYMLDIATGMHYISEKGLIHRDLAARNVMVSQNEICKVGDFGLLREIPKDAKIYVSKTKTPFPIRWMAPESHLRKEFSPASDVWSFGVVTWEMHNPTELPYKGLSNTEVAANVCAGTRLEVPRSYPPIVMNIMKACWQLEPSKRPSFLLIAMLLTNVVFGTD